MRPKDPEFDWFESCPLCQGRDLRVWEVSAAAYSVQPIRVRCAGCGLIFSNPQASHARLDYFYQHVYFQSSEHKAGYFSKEYAQSQRLAASKDLALLESFGAKGPVLDVGCAAGYFLEEARERGWKAEGLELSRAAAAEAKRKGFKVHVGAAESLRLGPRFGALHAAHTLEHVKDPAAFLARLASWLRPGGLMLLESPNCYHLWALVWHYTARLKGRTAPLAYAKEHTFDFSKATLRRLLEGLGLELLLLRAYEYPGGILNRRAKADDSLPKKIARPVWAALAGALRLERLLGSYLQAVVRRP